MFSSQWCAEPLAFSVVIIFVYGIYNITDIAIDDVQACGPSYPEANPGGGGGTKGAIALSLSFQYCGINYSYYNKHFFCGGC